MEETKLEKGSEAQESCAEMSDESRRDFVTKLVSAAGAIALSGLAASATDAIKYTEIKQSNVEDAANLKLSQIKVVQQKVYKVANGFRMSFSGRAIGEALVAAGMVPANTNLENATITLEFTT